MKNLSTPSSTEFFSTIVSLASSFTSDRSRATRQQRRKSDCDCIVLVGNKNEVYAYNCTVPTSTCLQANNWRATVL